MLASVFFVALVASASPETYARAEVDASGQLRIVTGDGRTLAPRMENGQVGIDRVVVSPDGRAVGWLALFPNCCTSYPIPLKLVVRVDGRVRAFVGSLPVWRWAFQAGGARVAFEQETVHGGGGIHYELRDLASGRLIETYEPAPAAGAPSQVPEWVAQLDADTTPHAQVPEDE